MGKKAKAPAAPDPQAMAQAQAQASKEAATESARLSQIGQVSPFGTVSYTGEVGTPERTQVVELSPERQQLMDILSGQAVSRAEQLPTTPFAMPEGRPELRGTEDVSKAQFEHSMRLMQPQVAQQERRFETMMANRGIPIGSEAYNDARAQFDRSRDAMMQDAAFRAMQAGQAEQGRLYGLERGAYEDVARDVMTERAQPMSELAGILSGQAGVPTPAAQAPGQYGVAAPDVMGAEMARYRAEMDRYNQEQRQRGGMLGGLAQLGTTVATGMPTGWMWG